MSRDLVVEGLAAIAACDKLPQSEQWIHADFVYQLVDALSKATADTRRLDDLERFGFRVQPDGMDGWLVTVRGTLGGMREGYLRYGAHRLREALDDARSVARGGGS